MRKLTRGEIVAEMMVRLQLRKLGGRLSEDIVNLVAEMLDLAEESVPNCYEPRVGYDWDVTDDLH